MPRIRNLRPGSPWVELRTTAQDWKNADPGLLSTMLCQLHLVRAFEESVLELAGEGLVHGPAHSSIGQEGGAVGSIVGLRSVEEITCADVTAPCAANICRVEPVFRNRQ
jgi:2-oxoisovalerate dehydrogenase E1 component